MNADDGNNEFTEVTEQSCGERLKASCCGLILGPIFIIGALILLIWNEGNAISTHRSLDQGEKVTIEITNISVINPANEGKLLHLFGPAVTNDTIVDTTFGVTTNTSILRLHRIVEMYQWTETQQSHTTKSGGTSHTTTTYSYSREWSTTYIDSSNFHQQHGHENPASMPYAEETFNTEPINLGAFTLPSIIIGRFNWWSPFMGISVDTIPDATLRNKTKLVGNLFYIGNDPNNPIIGDIRISYEKIESTTVSIVAQQTSDTFTAYKAKAGKHVLLVDDGVRSSHEMYKDAHDRATALAWILRCVGTFVVYLGLVLIMAPLILLVDIIPFIGDLLEGATFCIMIPVAFVISLTVISFTWLAYRPALMVPLVFVCFGAAYYSWYRKQRQKRVPEDNEEVDIEVSKDVQVEEINDDAVLEAIAVAEKEGRV